MIVYVITCGSYSDYHICGVALDKAKAESIVKLLTTEYDKPMIELYDTEQYDLSNGDPYKVVIEHGEVTSAENMVEDEYRTHYDLLDFKNGRHEYYRKLDKFVYYGTARDKDHAVKVAKEQWRIFKVRQETRRKSK